MKRIERAGRVIYLQRRLGWSIAFFVGSMAFVVLAWVRPTPEKKELGMALYYGVPLAIAALWALMRTPALAIDREQQKLMVVERQLLGRTQKSVYPLSELSVRLVSFPFEGNAFVTGTGHFIWIDLADGRSIPFRTCKGSNDPRPEAARLAADLGRPLTVVDRTRES